MNGWSLGVRQVRWYNKTFWRNPASAFFVFVFPLMLLVIFTSLLGSVFPNMTLATGQKVSPATFYIASVLAFSIFTACYSNVAIGVTSLREEGILKRVRGTPMPGWAYLLGKILHSCLMMGVLVGIVVLFALVFYQVDLPTVSLPAFIATLLVGAPAFCLLGLGCSAITPNVEAALPVTNATSLPVLFVSGVFLPTANAPSWVTAVAEIFPVKHFNDALLESFLPPPSNRTGWLPGDLLVVALWGLAAVLFVAWRFSWEPRR